MEIKIRSIKVKFENLSDDCDFLHDYHYHNLEYDNTSQFEFRGHLGSLQGTKTKNIIMLWKVPGMARSIGDWGGVKAYMTNSR